jgi:hypothetical protein
MTPVQKTFEFYECEHEGDLERHLENLQECGAVIEGTKINLEAETGVVVCTIADLRSFWAAFKLTESYEYQN